VDSDEITPEETEKIIEEIADIIHKREMYTPAVIFLESSKGVAHIAGEFIKIFVVPFIPVFSENWGEKSEKYITVLQSKKNIEKLIKRIEGFLEKRQDKMSTDPPVEPKP